MPALCVAFLEELSDKEKLAFDQLGRQEERAEMVLKHPFLADKFARLDYYDGDGDGGGETQLTIICQTSGGESPQILFVICCLYADQVWLGFGK